MHEIAQSESLFEAMARSRSEWLAQGAFIHAIHTAPALLSHLAKLAGAAKTDGYRLISESVEEDGPGARRREATWRPDLELRFQGGKRRLRIELKLWAALSDAQVKGLQDQDTLLVAPRGHRDWARAYRSVSWLGLTKFFKKDSPLQEFFRQIERFSRGQWGRLTNAQAEADFGQLIDSPDGNWPRIYRFLSTIDQTLNDLRKDDYTPSTQWGYSQSSHRPYYGYYFSMESGRKPFTHWLGFLRDDLGFRFSVQEPDPKKGRKASWRDLGFIPPGDYDAVKLAKLIAKRL